MTVCCATSPARQGCDHREVLRTMAQALQSGYQFCLFLVSLLVLSAPNTLGYPVQTCRCLVLPFLLSDAGSLHSACIGGEGGDPNISPCEGLGNSAISLSLTLQAVLLT